MGDNILFNNKYISIFLGVLFYIIFSNNAYAQDINEIAENISDSSSALPGFIAALSYISGTIFGIIAIFKAIDHVNNPTQTPLRVPIIRFLIGGALFALPIIIEAAITTINGGAVTNFSSFEGSISGVMSLTAYLTPGNFNSILNSIVFSTSQLPALVTVTSYLLALILTVSALYKTRDHVDDPDRAPLKDAVIRYLTAGALFALPTVFEAMYTTINGTGLGVTGTASLIASGVSFFYSTETVSGECLLVGANTVGEVVCNTMTSAMGLPEFLALLSYMIGLVFGLWAILKIRDHVNNPSQTSLWEGVSRLLAGGAFFALPVVTMALKYSVTPNALVVATAAGTNTGFNETIPDCTTSNSLDEAMICFMSDILGPSHVLLNFFSFVAGMIFIMIGVSRLTKTAQEGARGPGGLGTITTFVIGGLLMSATTILRALSTSFFDSPITVTDAQLTYTTGMSVTETAAVHNVVSAVLKFMMIIGMVSFVRGIFIMRDVAEGSQQASTMAGITHIMGGALAVNLGPLLNAVQQTLGITAFGVAFS